MKFVHMFTLHFGLLAVILSGKKPPFMMVPLMVVKLNVLAKIKIEITNTSIHRKSVCLFSINE